MARRKLGLGGPIKPSEVVERVQVDRASDRRLSDDEDDFDFDLHLHDDQEDKSTLPRRPHAPTGEDKDVLDALGDDALESLTTNLTDERPWLGELPPEMATGPTVGAPAETVEKLRPDQLSPPAGPAPPPTSQPPIAGLPPAASQDLPPSPPTSALELPSEMATGPTVGAPAETVEKLRPDQLSPPAGPAPPPTSQPPIAGLPPAASLDLPPSPPTSALELPSEMATGPTVGGHSPDLPPSDSTALPPVEAQDLPTGPEPEKPLAVGGVPAVDQAAGKTAFAADPLEGSAEAPPAHDSEVAERNRDRNRLTRILENLENLPPSDSTALPPVEAQDLPTGPEPEKPIAVGGVPAVDQAAGKTAFAADPLEGSAEAPPAHDSEVAERNRDRLTRILENLENLPPSDSTALPPVEAQDLPTGPEPEKPIAVGGVPAVDQAAGKTAFAADPLEGSAEAPPAHDSEVAERNRERNRLTRILENLENLPPDQVRYPEAFELLAKHLRSVLTPSHLGQTVREETRRLAEQVAYVLSLPHHGAWGLHDVLTGQDSDLSPTERSFDVLGTFPLANIDIEVASLIPGLDFTRSYDDDKAIRGPGDWLSAGLAPAEVLPAHLAAKVPAQALELGRSTLAKLSRLFNRLPQSPVTGRPTVRTRWDDLSEGRPQPHSKPAKPPLFSPVQGGLWPSKIDMTRLRIATLLERARKWDTPEAAWADLGRGMSQSRFGKSPDIDFWDAVGKLQRQRDVASDLQFYSEYAERMARKLDPPGGGGVERFDALLSPKSTPPPTAAIDQGLSVATRAPDFAPPAEIRELLDRTYRALNAKHELSLAEKAVHAAQRRLDDLSQVAADPTEIATALQQNLWTPAVSTIDGAALYRARADVDPQTGSGPSIRPDTTPAAETGTKTATVTEPAPATEPDVVHPNPQDTAIVPDVTVLPEPDVVHPNPEDMAIVPDVTVLPEPDVVHPNPQDTAIVPDVTVLPEPDVVHPNPQDTAIVPDVTVLPEPDVVHPNPQDTAIVPDVTVLPEPDVVHPNPQDTAIVPDVTVLPEPDVVHPNPQDTAIVPDVTVLPEPDVVHPNPEDMAIVPYLTVLPEPDVPTVAATVKKIGTATATETLTASDTLVEPPVTPNEAPQQEPLELRAPNPTALRAPDAESLRTPRPPTETFARVKPQVTPGAADSPADLPQATPRPPGSYPRRIEHNERVEYRYHPETGEFDARLVESSDPVVTRWDMTPPDRDERQVGTWDVMPTDDGVVVTNGQRVSVPEGIKDQLVREAERTEEPVSKTATLRYQHDLDTRETEYRMNTPSAAEMAETLRERSRQRGNGKLDPRYQMLADAMKAQAQEKRGQSRRRRASNRTRENQPTYSLPQIVITQEPISRRRIGGL